MHCSIRYLLAAAGIVLCSSTFADPAADAYRRALESGNAAALVRAQSFLAPPNCYDINRWHGITFTRMAAREIRERMMNRDVEAELDAEATLSHTT